MGSASNDLCQLNHCELALAHIPKFRATCEGGYAVRDAIVTAEGAGIPTRSADN